jgi:ATP-dependent RNA helicase DDX54/DBP10
MLFSATLPKALVEFAKAGLENPTLVRLDVDNKIPEDLEVKTFRVLLKGIFLTFLSTSLPSSV